VKNKILRKNSQCIGSVVLLSLGGRLGSPMLAHRLALRGYEVHVLSKRFPGHEMRHAHRWHMVDVLNDNVELKRITQILEPVGIFSEARNVLLPAKAKLRESQGLRSMGPDSWLTSTSKIAFRESIDAAGLTNLKWAKTVNNILPELAFPYVLKPDKGTGSRGVFLVQSEEDRIKAIKELSELKETVTVGGEYIAEAYIEGRQFDVEGICRDGNPYALSITEECYENVDHAFPSLWYLFSPPITEKLRNNLLDTAHKVIKAAGVISGAWHCEMRVASDGRILPLDYSNRMGYPRMVTECSGVDFLEAYIDSLSDEAEFKEPTPKRGTVYQRFLRTERENKAFSNLASAHPQHIIEFRTQNMVVAGVNRYGRISIRAASFEELRQLLAFRGLEPDEWLALYNME